MISDNLLAVYQVFMIKQLFPLHCLFIIFPRQQHYELLHVTQSAAIAKVLS